jgi:integral membrane protein
MTAMRNPVHQLRHLALIEGVSFLLLLFIAMPLKYLADLPAAVTWVGWIHGVLFMLLCALLLYCTVMARWSWWRTLLILIAALVPFGPFAIDRRMKQYVQEVEQQQPQPAA